MKTSSVNVPPSTWNGLSKAVMAFIHKSCMCVCYLVYATVKESKRHRLLLIDADSLSLSDEVLIIDPDAAVDALLQRANAHRFHGSFQRCTSKFGAWHSTPNQWCVGSFVVGTNRVDLHNKNSTKPRSNSSRRWSNSSRRSNLSLGIRSRTSALPWPLEIVPEPGHEVKITKEAAQFKRCLRTRFVLQQSKKKK